jgi:hypothetical protein
MSECEEELIKTGRRVDENKARRHSPVPDAFAANGYAFWWGAVQFKMFQMQQVVAEHIHAQAMMMNGGHGFPFGLPLGGLHVRHGDKHSDGFKDHSLEEELSFVRRSPDCFVQNSRGECFARVNTSSFSSIVVLHRLAKKHGIIINVHDIEAFNRTSSDGNAAIAIEPKSLWPSPTAHRSSGHEHDSASAAPAPAAASFPAVYVVPVNLFVASDDANVVLSAARQGLLTDAVGVSQDGVIAKHGMLSTLLTHPEIAHAACLEIIADIYFLSQCTSLVGIAASQVFRMAVALSNVTGSLRFAAAVDGPQIPRVKQMSVKYDVPFPEEFFLG